jgi:hypothetical protein
VRKIKITTEKYLKIRIWNFQMESEDEESVTGSEEEVRMAMNFCLLIIQSRWYYERLDQTRGLETDMLRTGIEPGPPQGEESIL